MKLYTVIRNAAMVGLYHTRNEAVLHVRKDLADTGKPYLPPCGGQDAPCPSWTCDGVIWNIRPSDPGPVPSPMYRGWMGGYPEKWDAYRSTTIEGKRTSYKKKMDGICCWFVQYRCELLTCLLWATQDGAIAIVKMDNFLDNKMNVAPPVLSDILDVLDAVASIIREEVTEGREEARALKWFLDFIKQQEKDGIPLDKITDKERSRWDRVLRESQTKKVIGDLKFFRPAINSPILPVRMSMVDAVREAKEHLKKLEEILIPFST